MASLFALMPSNQVGTFAFDTMKSPGGWSLTTYM
jgi:hypothetical protein